MTFPIWWESHSKFHGSSHHQPDQLPTINFQLLLKCYSVAAHSLIACRFEGAMMWCENMARRPSVTGPPGLPCHSGAGIGESWNKAAWRKRGCPKSYWCLVGNGWEWGNGIIIDSYCGSFPHSLLSNSKKWKDDERLIFDDHGVICSGL